MNETIKRVAEAIWKEGLEDHYDGMTFKDSEKLARAAIEAMKPATDQQVRNYFDMAKAEGYSDIEACFKHGTYERAIDAALKDD